MSDTVVFVVTHGDKETGPNPRMTNRGVEEIENLRPLLPIEPSAVVCGTGQRHRHVAGALKLTPTRFTTVVGGVDSLDVIGGKKVIVLSHGELVGPDQQYTTVQDMIPAVLALLPTLPDGAVICAGRPLMIMLGKPQAKSAAVYQVTCRDGKVVGIAEVTAGGGSEEGTV